MLGDISRWIRLDEQIEEAMVFVGRDWCVGADDFLRLTFNCCSDRDVLPYGEAQDIVGGRKVESVADQVSIRKDAVGENYHSHCYVMRKDRLLFELEFLKRIRFEGFFHFYIQALCQFQ